MPQNHYHKPSHGSIRWAPVLLAAVVVWLIPLGAAEAQTLPELSIDSPSVHEPDSGTMTLTYTVSLSESSGQPVTVEYADAGTGTATVGSDYEALTSGTLTFDPSETSQTVDVLVKGDRIDEEHQTIVVTLSNVTNATIATATGTGTITDNDPPASLIQLPNQNAPEGDSGTNNVEVTITRVGWGTEKTVTVEYMDSGTGTATAGEDYATFPNGTLTFPPAGGRDRMVTVTVIGDTDLEPDETIILTLFNVTNATLPQNGQIIHRIINDELTLSVEDAEAEEGNDVEFQVTLSGTPTENVSVTCDTGTYPARPRSDQAGRDDFVSIDRRLTFVAGATGSDLTQTVAVPTTDDTVAENSESFTLRMWNAENANINQRDHIAVKGTILDNDSTPGLRIYLNHPIYVHEGHSGTKTLTYRVDLSEASNQTVRVEYADAGTGSATAATDYTTIPSGTLTFDPALGETSKTIVVTVLGDVLDEPNETIDVTLSNPTNATIETNMGTATGTITDDDPTPMLSIDSPSVTEGNSGTTTLTYTVSLSAASGRTVTVNYADSGGTATAGEDYATFPNGTLTFTPGETSQTIVVTVNGDALEEYPYETIDVTLSAPTNATIATNRGTGTGRITDDDGPPRVTLVLSPPSISENNGVSTVTATLSWPSPAATTLTVSAEAGSGAEADDFTQTGTTLTIDAGAITSAGLVTITGVDNDVAAADKRVTVSATVSNTQNLVLPENQTLTLTDDDAPPTPRGTRRTTTNAAVTVTPTTGLTTTEAGGTADFTVVLNRQPTADVTVEVGSGDPEEGTVSPASLSFTPGTWATAQTVTITGVDDDMDDGDQSYTIMLAPTVSADTNYSGMDPDDVGVTNMDDDVPADRIVLSVAPASVAEEAGAQSVAVTAAFPQGAARLLTDTLVTIAVTGKTASAEDFAAVADFPVIIPQLAMSGTATFVLTPILDVLREGDETVTVSGVAEGFTVTGTEVTIVDDIRRAKQTMATVNRAIPPQVTQAMAASTVTSVQSRIEAGTACGGQGPSYQVASHQSLAGIMQTVSDGLRDGRLTVERLLGGSSFVLPLNTTDDGQKTGWRGLTIWGTGDYRNLGGGEAIDWDGELFGGHLGVDTCLNADLLVGLTTSVSQGAFDYAGLSGANPIGGSYTSRMTSVHPYVNWSSPEGLDLWGTLGYGWGKITIAEQGVPQRESSDTTMQTAAVGANGRVLPVTGLLPGGTTSLRLKAEALLTTVKVEGNGGVIEPLALDARRFRLALEGSHERELASGARLVPTVEVGVRHDGGDGVEGTGLEIGGGLRYVDQTRGLTVAGRGRALVTYGAQAYREWGANLFIQMDPGADGQGLSFTLLPAYGQTASGVSRLWEQGGNGVGAARQDAAGRLEALVGYGLPALEGKGLLTPYSAVTLESTGHQLRLGGLLGIGSSFNVSLEGTREVRRETPTVYGVRLQANRRF